MADTSSSGLAADLGRACVEKEGVDVSLVARDGSTFSAHELVLSCRSPVLAALLQHARKSRSAQEIWEALMEAEDAGISTDLSSIEIGECMALRQEEEDLM